MVAKAEALGTTERAARTPIATVLVVDDIETNRALAQSILEDEGYRIILAWSGAEGIAAFQTERPDCVLLDIRMPEIDGFATCERIRALPRGSETPVLFLTALRDVDTFDRALRVGGRRLHHQARCSHRARHACEERAQAATHESRAP